MLYNTPDCALSHKKKILQVQNTMKKKTTQETKIHSNPLRRKNSKKYNRKIVFQKNKDTPPIEIDSYLNTIQTPTKENQEPPKQKNRERIFAEIDSLINHREHPERYNRILHFKKNKGTLLAKKPSKTKTITEMLTSNLIEIILFLIGLFYLTQPTMLNIKIGLTLVLIATFLLFLLNDTQQPTLDTEETDSAKPVYVEKNILKESLRKKIRSLPLPNTICLILILWTLFVFVVVNDLEIYIILLFIGILITREITDHYISNTYKMKLNLYILIFLVTYVVLISQKIIDILNI